MKRFQEMPYEFPALSVCKAVVRQIQDHMKCTLREAITEYRHGVESGQHFLNDEYLVVVRPTVWYDEESEMDPVEMAHLSISRHDKDAIHDWRVLQNIKTMLLGPNCEAVELYPANDRLVDASNQYHLWCLAPGARFPFGFKEKLVNYEDMRADGTRQRPHDSAQLKILDDAIEASREETIGEAAQKKQPAMNRKEQEQFQRDFQRGKEEYRLGAYKIPFNPKLCRRRTEAYMLGQRAAAMEILFERQKKHNKEIMEALNG